jgi:hypothetical protein
MRVSFKQADAGVEAVHHRRFVMHPVGLDVVAAFLQCRARRGRQANLDGSIARHGQHLLRGKGEAIDQ